MSTVQALIKLGEELLAEPLSYSNNVGKLLAVVKGSEDSQVSSSLLLLDSLDA